MDRVAEFVRRFGLSPEAREELERMMAGYGLPVLALPDSHADSTLLFDPRDLADLPEREGVNLAAGTVTDRYEDLAFLGRGAFAEVRRVRDKALNRVMAMKILDRKVENAAMRARFVQEAQATAQLQHPGIVPVHELGILPDSRPFFTMEEVRGRTLSAVVAAVHRASVDVWAATPDDWTLRRLIEVFRRVTEATAFAHSRGVVHRDLKPANVMVGAFGEVRVMDWGIAKILGSALPTAEFEAPTSPTATREGMVAGTPAFMAPEQARGEVHRIDRRTDVYALGAILYYILANRPPFDGPSSAEVLVEVCRGEPAALVGRSDGPLLPAGLVRIAEKAMSAEPDARFADAGELGDAVAHWLDGAERRECALRAVARAAEARRLAKKEVRRARSLRDQAALELAALPMHAEEDAKAAAWEKEDLATGLERSAPGPTSWRWRTSSTRPSRRRPSSPRAT
ncbi:MAG: serine/threonine protein kinase [Alphaproteobacteria bacterium]|nr:serine/threonine protein kinase [Alphaproteobacteria bacterium]